MKKTEFKKRKKLSKRFLLLNPVIGILASLSVFGIGYGSWSLSDYIEINNTSFEIGDLINLPSYVKDFKVTTFKISPQGILRDEVIVYDSNIQINFKIILKNGLFLSYYPANNNFNLDVRIQNHGTYNFFTTDILVPNPAISYNVTDGTNSFNGTTDVVVNDKIINFHLNYNNQNLTNVEYLDYSVQVKLNFEKYKNDFENLIYNQLGDKPIAFNFFMGVNG